MESLDLLGCYCLRGKDHHGFGHYGASRGSRKHKGIDVVNEADQPVVSCSGGHISKIGYPYNPNDEAKGHLRYVEVTTANKDRERYFYCSPAEGIELGKKVKRGDVIGMSQDLCCIYGMDMTQHLHFEVIRNVGGESKFINPTNYLVTL